MGVALRLYEQLTDAGEDKQRARLIAEAFEALEARYPHIPELATRSNLSEAELKLTKEIEQLRAELKETELKLSKEIEQARAELKETELKLSKEIEQVRLQVEQVRAELKETELKLTKEIESVRREIKDVEVRLTQAIHRQTLWVVLAIGGITGFIRWLDFLLK